MNIIQAKELALAGKTVIGPMGKEFNESDFADSRSWNPEHVFFGEWREKREPRRNYRIEIDGELCDTVYGSRELAENQLVNRGLKRIVEFVEVIT